MRAVGPALLAIALGASDGRAQSTRETRQLLLVVEDDRSDTEAGRAPLIGALKSGDEAVVVQAVRALGRFERAGLAASVIPLLADSRPAVRTAAAHALGQLAQDSSGVETIGAALRARAPIEADPDAVGAIARSLGRISYRRVEDANAARDIVVRVASRSGPPTVIRAATRALESLGRTNPSLPPDPATTSRLRALTHFTTSAAHASVAAAVRRAALAALARAGLVDSGAIASALVDPDAEVRRSAVLILADSGAVAGRRELLARALIDSFPMVRFEALRAFGRHFQRQDCGAIIRALRDPWTPAALQAIDLLGNGCSDPTMAADRLWPLVDTLASIGRGAIGSIASWHRGAHALVALAKVDPARGRVGLARLTRHPVWQVRMYAARAAALLGDADGLLVFAEDGEDNVREAAIDGLSRTRGASASPTYLSQLDRDDYQLLITAAKALEGTPDKATAFSRLLRALQRITARRMDTSRDARVALLERLGEVGGADVADSLAPWLEDYDPVVATRTAAILGQWTNRAWSARPKPLPRPPISVAEIDTLVGSRLRITMSPSSGGGTFEIELLPELAPVTVLRVARLARQGYYDGLTFHRMVPNFVIQGGSPGANEYMGDGPYLRDEVGPVSHERGTLGISTRGRDTGDAQIFVNLVENLRLDFNYTVWGVVVAGMNVVDEVLEGDVMERVDVVRR